MENELLEQEIELLQEIYIKELNISRDTSGVVTSVSVQLRPSTCENEDEQWVSLVLVLDLPSKYPDAVPCITLREPRGLSEEHLTSIGKTLKHLAEERLGGAVLYELIESARESLTTSNVPHGECVICLEEFVLPNEEAGAASAAGSAPFLRTSCHHYFHCACLRRYMDHCATVSPQENHLTPSLVVPKRDSAKVACPVCRVPLSQTDLDTVNSCPRHVVSSASHTEVIVLSEDIRREQEKRARLFTEQKNKGGIIDLEAERSKYLLPADGVFVALPEAEPLTASAETTSEDSALQASASTGNLKQFEAKSDSRPSKNSRPGSHRHQRDYNRDRDNRKYDRDRDVRRDNRDRDFQRDIRDKDFRRDNRDRDFQRDNRDDHRDSQDSKQGRSTYDDSRATDRTKEHLVEGDESHSKSLSNNVSENLKRNEKNEIRQLRKDYSRDRPDYRNDKYSSNHQCGQFLDNDRSYYHRKNSHSNKPHQRKYSTEKSSENALPSEPNPSDNLSKTEEKENIKTSSKAQDDIMNSVNDTSKITDNSDRVTEISAELGKNTQSSKHAELEKQHSRDGTSRHSNANQSSSTSNRSDNYKRRQDYHYRSYNGRAGAEGKNYKSEQPYNHQEKNGEQSHFKNLDKDSSTVVSSSVEKAFESLNVKASAESGGNSETKSGTVAENTHCATDNIAAKYERDDKRNSVNEKLDNDDSNDRQRPRQYSNHRRDYHHRGYGAGNVSKSGDVASRNGPLDNNVVDRSKYSENRDSYNDRWRDDRRSNHANPSRKNYESKQDRFYYATGCKSKVETGKVNKADVEKPK